MAEEKIEIEQIEQFTEELSDEALDREGASSCHRASVYCLCNDV